MSAMQYEIIGVSMICLFVCLGADQRKHQSSASQAYVSEIYRWPVNSLHKRPNKGAVTCAVRPESAWLVTFLIGNVSTGVVTWSALRCGASGESGKKVAAAPLSKTAEAAAAAETWFAKLPLDYMLHNRFPWKRSGRRSSMWPPYSLRRNLSAAACRPCDRSLTRKMFPVDDVTMRKRHGYSCTMKCRLCIYGDVDSLYNTLDRNEKFQFSYNHKSTIYSSYTGYIEYWEVCKYILDKFVSGGLMCLELIYRACYIKGVSFVIQIQWKFGFDVPHYFYDVTINFCKCHDSTAVVSFVNSVGLLHYVLNLVNRLQDLSLLCNFVKFEIRKIKGTKIWLVLMWPSWQHESHCSLLLSRSCSPSLRKSCL